MKTQTKGDGDSKLSATLKRCMHRAEKRWTVTPIHWAVMIKKCGLMVTTYIAILQKISHL